MGLLPPNAPTTMETVGDYREVKWAGIPIGVRIPVPGDRCRQHDWKIEEYRSIGGINRDKVCKNCPERQYLERRPYPPGQKPNFQAQLAAAMRNQTS